MLRKWRHLLLSLFSRKALIRDPLEFMDSYWTDTENLLGTILLKFDLMDFQLMRRLAVCIKLELISFSLGKTYRWVWI